MCTVKCPVPRNNNDNDKTVVVLEQKNAHTMHVQTQDQMMYVHGCADSGKRPRSMDILTPPLPSPAKSYFESFHNLDKRLHLSKSVLHTACNLKTILIAVSFPLCESTNHSDFV